MGNARGEKGEHVNRKTRRYSFPRSITVWDLVGCPLVNSHNWVTSWQVPRAGEAGVTELFMRVVLYPGAEFPEGVP